MKLSMATSSLTCYIDAGIDEKTAQLQLMFSLLLTVSLVLTALL